MVGVWVAVGGVVVVQERCVWVLLSADDCQAGVLIGIHPDCRYLQWELLLDLKHGLRNIGIKD